MPVEILICARDIVLTDHNKGDVTAIRSADEVAELPWGTGESLPDFIIARVASLDKPAVLQYQQRLRNKFTYELLNQNAQGRRYRISMNSRGVRWADRMGFDLRSDIRTLLIDTYNATVFSVAPDKTSAVFDIPNTDWVQLRADAKALVEDVELPVRRFSFNSAAVDNAIAAGGIVNVTASQLLANLIDQEI